MLGVTDKTIYFTCISVNFAHYEISSVKIGKTDQRVVKLVNYKHLIVMFFTNIFSRIS